MIRIENDCCDCGLHDCYMCSLREVEHHYCDFCGEELSDDDSVYIEGSELCPSCAWDLYPEEMEDEE